MSNEGAYRYATGRKRVSGTRWASDEEIKSDLFHIPLYNKTYGACGIPLISDGLNAYVDNSDSHTLILGSTGSKKTRLFVLPMMNIIARSGESVVCTDPKGELYEHSSGIFAQQGYDIKVINLRDPQFSNGWNPIHAAQSYYINGDSERSISLLNDLAASLFPITSKNQDPFWQQQSTSVFVGLCSLMVENPHAFPPEVSNFITLRLLSNELRASDGVETGTTNLIAEMYPPMSNARINLSAVLAGSEKTFDNIMASYLAPMQVLYSQPSLINMLSLPEINFETLGDHKTALYLIMPDEKTTLHPLASLIVKQCYTSLIYAAQRNQGMQLPVRVNFLLDEFANLPAIPDMNAMISAARSRNIRFYLIVQSVHQLQSKYGDDAYTIRGNCSNWVFLTSRELELLKELEALCGVNQNTGEALISVTQLQQLDKNAGEALILLNRNYPYITHVADIDYYPYDDIPAAAQPDLRKKAESIQSVEPQTIMGRHMHISDKGNPRLDFGGDASGDDDDEDSGELFDLFRVCF